MVIGKAGPTKPPGFHDRSFGFGLKAFRKYPELIPLVAVVGFACSMGVFGMSYSLYQKPDVALNKSADTPPWERVDPETKQKLITFNTKYQKIPELEALRKEIGSYKTR